MDSLLKTAHIAGIVNAVKLKNKAKSLSVSSSVIFLLPLQMDNMFGKIHHVRGARHMEARPIKTRKITSTTTENLLPCSSMSLIARLCALTILVTCQLLCVSCASKDVRPDIVLIVIDTLRADHVGCYGYPRSTTPFLDSLSREGVLFETAYAPMGTTSPSLATVLTSQHPLSHGLVRNGMSLKDGADTLQEALRESGYTTAAFVSSYPVSRRFGFDQGWDHFDDLFTSDASTFKSSTWEGHQVQGGFDRRATDTVNAALTWLGSHETPQPLFLWIHLFDPHRPFDAPPSYNKWSRQNSASQNEIDQYDAEIRYADHETARLVKAVTRIRDDRPKLLVITGDHGEGLGDHGWPAHNRFTYEEEVRVPLVLSGHGSRKKRISHPAHLVDVAPTVLAAANSKIRTMESQGVNLLPFVDGSIPEDPERPLFLQRPYYEGGRPRFREKGHGFGIRKGRWKYFEAVEDPKRELYDLMNDPGEYNNIAHQKPDEVLALSSMIKKWKDMRTRDWAEAKLSPEDEEALRSLGYTQ